MYIYKNIITIEPGKRSGKPCIRGVYITGFSAFLLPQPAV